MAPLLRAPELRRVDFEDVFLPQRLQWAVAEASRCLLCDQPPCALACPAGVDIKRFIRSLKTRNLRSAVQTIRESNFFVATCGRICPQAQLCERRCSASGLARPIAIGELQRFVGEQAIRERIGFVFPEVRSTGEVAIVGGGPAGLATAYYLRREGIVADLYERREQLGGVPLNGIPHFRLPRPILEAELAFVGAAGLRLVHAQVRDLAELVGRYRAVFLGCGLDVSTAGGLAGAHLAGAFEAGALLEAVNRGVAPPCFTGTTLVIGGGNTAVDAAAVARRLGSPRVIVAYRRTEAEMPAWPHHRAWATEEGVEWLFLLLPLAIQGDAAGHVCGVEMQQARLGAPDPSGRPQPVPLEGALLTIECRQVILALGTRSSGWWRECGLETNEQGLAVDPETMETSRSGIFAGGDVIRGGGTVVQAVADGHKAARVIARRLLG